MNFLAYANDERDDKGDNERLQLSIKEDGPMPVTYSNTKLPPQLLIKEDGTIYLTFPLGDDEKEPQSGWMKEDPMTVTIFAISYNVLRYGGNFCSDRDSYPYQYTEAEHARHQQKRNDYVESIRVVLRNMQMGAQKTFIVSRHDLANIQDTLRETGCTILEQTEQRAPVSGRIRLRILCKKVGIY